MNRQQQKKLGVIRNQNNLNKHLEDIMNQSAKTRGDYYDKKTGKYYDLHVCVEKDPDNKGQFRSKRVESVTHCGGTSSAIKKLFGTKKGKPIMANVHGYQNIQGNGVEHAWNRTRDGSIIDASREQFGDEKGVHIIKPDDPRFHEYTELSEYSNGGSQYGNVFTVPIKDKRIREQNDKRIKRWQNRNTQDYYEDKALEKFREIHK